MSSAELTQRVVKINVPHTCTVFFCCGPGHTCTCHFVGFAVVRVILVRDILLVSVVVRVILAQDVVFFFFVFFFFFFFFLLFFFVVVRVIYILAHYIDGFFCGPGHTCR